MGGRRGAGSATIAALAASLAFAACGEDENGYSNERIVDTVGLEELDSAFAIGGDPFCSVKNGLLNDADEVDDARDRDELGLVIASRQGNVGVEGVPPFAPDCKRKAQRALDRLDPVPKED